MKKFLSLLILVVGACLFISTSAMANARETVAPNGAKWIVKRDNAIVKCRRGRCHEMPGLARRIASGDRGHVWVIGVKRTGPGFGIYYWARNNWQQVQGSAVELAVTPRGVPWVLNEREQIFRWDGNRWQRMPGYATRIWVGRRGQINVRGRDGFYRWHRGEWRRTRR